jgi:ribosome maturation factor RimP
MTAETATLPFLENNGVGAKVTALLAPSLEAMGYELVRVKLIGVPGAKSISSTLQIMIDRADGRAINVDDCETASRSVSAILDVEDPISGAYNLEMSSPGIDRPLTREKDFVRFAGFEARLETSLPVDGRRRFKGEIKGLVGDGSEAVQIVVDGEEFTVPLSALSRAKLVLTDALIAWSQAQAAATGGAAEGSMQDVDEIVEDDQSDDGTDDFDDGADGMAAGADRNDI